MPSSLGLPPVPVGWAKEFNEDMQLSSFNLDVSNLHFFIASLFEPACEQILFCSAAAAYVGGNRHGGDRHGDDGRRGGITLDTARGRQRRADEALLAVRGGDDIIAEH